MTTKCVSTSNNRTSVMCESTHLTSFAVLVDVTGALGVTDITITAQNMLCFPIIIQKVSTDIQFALEVVSYIGCAISIVCLLITMIFFLLQGYFIDQYYLFIKLQLPF